MDIKKLTIFINLVETRSFSKTAINMHVTQPTVTHTIKSIESEIGTQLFNTNKHYVAITENGKTFYHDIKPLINNYYSALQNVKKKNLNAESQITIGYSYTPFNQTYLPIWINNFRKNNPNIKFNLTDLNHNDFKQDLISNNLDLVITTGRDAQGLSNIKRTILFSEYFKAIVPNDNILSKRKILNINDFTNQNMLFLDNTWAAIDLISLQNKIKNSVSNISITYANDISALDLLIKSQQGIDVGFYCLYPELEKNSCYIPLNWKSKVELAILTSKTVRKKAVNSFIKSIETYTYNMTFNNN